MKTFTFCILMLFLSSCSKKYNGMYRSEILVTYPQNIYGKPIKRKRSKIKIEYRKYDHLLKITELGKYGKAYGNVQHIYNPKDSSMTIISSSGRNYKKLDRVFKYKYDVDDRLIEMIVHRCDKNKIDKLEYRTLFNHSKGTSHTTRYNDNAEEITTEKTDLKTPPEITEDIFHPEKSSLRGRLYTSTELEFIYDKRKRLVKIISKDKFDNITEITRFKYRKIKVVP